MATVYEIAIDKNGDGFIGWDVGANDVPNRVPNPVTYAGLGLLAVNGTAALDWLETPYGTQVVTADLSAGAAGVFIGRDVGGVADIPITENLQHTAGLWVRLAPGQTGTAAMQLTVLDQSLNTQATSSITVTTVWQQVQRTFTSSIGDTHICIGVEQLAGDAVSVQLAGPMLVRATALPAVFNSGDLTEREDAITGDVLAMHWRLGMRRPFELVAAPTAGTITVDNVDGRYAPERAMMRLDPFTRVKLRATLNGTTTHLFSGWISHVEPDPAGRTATLHLHGPETALRETRVLTDLLTDVAPDAVLQTVLDQSPLDRYEQNFRTSATRFAYVGDTWDDGVRASAAIAQVLEAERGRFFSDRAGRLVFYDRAYLPNLPVNATAFTDAFEDVDYSYGDLLLNWVRVELRPRALGAAGSTVWTLKSAQAIPPNDCRTLLVRFRDENGDRIGATALITPVANTDYTANLAADGSGADMTGDVSVQFLSGGSASAVYLQVCNTSAQTVYVQAGLQVRGQPLEQGNPLLVEVRDAASIDAYGPRSLLLNMPYLVTAAEAQSLAEAVVFLRKRPAGVARTLHLSNRIRFADALTLTLFDQVRVTESSTGHSDDYFIVAEEHTIDQGGVRHRVAWTLEPVNPGGVWKLNVDGLGTGTRLGVRF